MRTVLTVFKWIAGVGVVLALILGGIGVFLFPKIQDLVESQAGGARGEGVRLHSVERDRLVRTISAPAEVLPQTEVNISARVSARIVELPVEPGDYVEEGDLLIRLEDREYVASLDSAQASLKAERARLEATRATFVNATSEWERVQSLFESGDVSKAELDGAKAELDRAEANLRAAEENIEVARARVTQAEEDLSNTVIRSPITGYATRVNSKVGETVLGTANNVGTTIMTLADFSDIDVVAEVDESDIAQIKPGQEARIYINAFPDEVFEGTVNVLDLLRTTSRTGADVFEVKITLHRPDDRQFFAGLTASADIEVDTLEGVTTVPSQAVVDRRIDELPIDIVEGASEKIDMDKTFARVVYLFDDGKAKVNPVKIGPSNLRTTAILAGLEPGDQVIVGPYRALIDLKHDNDVYDLAEEERREREAALARASGEGEGQDRGDAAASEESGGSEEADQEAEPAKAAAS
jgi:HlyD family secretion protein